MDFEQSYQPCPEGRDLDASWSSADRPSVMAALIFIAMDSTRETSEGAEAMQGV